MNKSATNEVVFETDETSKNDYKIILVWLLIFFLWSMILKRWWVLFLGAIYIVIQVFIKRNKKLTIFQNGEVLIQGLTKISTKSTKLYYSVSSGNSKSLNYKIMVLRYIVSDKILFRIPIDNEDDLTKVTHMFDRVKISTKRH